MSVYHHRDLMTSAVNSVQPAGGGDFLWSSILETRKVNRSRKGNGNGRKNKAIVGVAVARVADGKLPKKGPVAQGIKIEDRFNVDERTKMNASVALMTTKIKMGQNAMRDTAYAASVEGKMKRGEQESTRVTVGANMLRYKRDTQITGSAQMEAPVTPGTAGFAKVSLNNKGSGSITTRFASTDRVELGWAMLVPVMGALWGKFRGDQAF